MSSFLPFGGTLVSIGTADLGFVELDCSEEEMHKFSATITKHPIESNASVADHVVHEPLTLTITGHVSDSPLLRIGTIPPTPFDKRADEAFRKLTILKDLGEPLQVVTKLQELENMVITSIDIPRNAQAGDALTITITLEQVTLVESSSVAAPQAKTPTGTPAKELGTKPTSAAPAATSGASGSVLFGWLGG